MGSSDENEEELILWLRRGIRLAVRVLAILMLFVIWWGVADVIYVLFNRIAAHPHYLLNISDILATFGAFMAVLIAIEIFVNITSYLRDNTIQLNLVLATALMAISRKVIVLDYKEVTPEYIVATALIVASLSLAYWLVVVKNPEENP